ncbi:MAG TPA: hypothetical protein PLI45_04715 [Candidatus Woesebacteria bacterium]|nr:hypothetical protein [Candidatus Woesebacteria bacterium]
MSGIFLAIKALLSCASSGLSTAEVESLIDLLNQNRPQIPFSRYTVKVWYLQDVEKMIMAGKYDWFRLRYVPLAEKYEAQVEVFILDFDHVINSDDVIAEMNKWGLRPATLKELSALGASRPDLQLEYTILALGGPTSSKPDGIVFVPALGSNNDGNHRYLDYEGRHGDWTTDYRFAAVRK